MVPDAIKQLASGIDSHAEHERAVVELLALVGAGHLATKSARSSSDCAERSALSISVIVIIGSGMMGLNVG